MSPAAAAVRPSPVAWVDPEAVFCALSSAAHDVFWLDAGPDARDGWSWIGTGAREDDAERVRAVAVAGAAGGPGDGGAFRGGWVGWFDYDSGAAAAGAPAVGEESGRWIRADQMLAFDHATRRAWAFAPAGGMVMSAHGAASHAVAGAPPPAPSREAVSRDTPEHYASLIDQCRTRIRDGDAYLLCLTTSFSVSGRADPVEVYRRLRRISPSHHGGFVRVGNTALCSASPERFLALAGGTVSTHPIKGTRPRGDDPAHDRALAEELAADVKERAENVMIVDLVRNDLSAVCTPGTVGVDRLLEVETFAAVHQLVSSVSGRLAPGAALGDVLDAAFPAGSMTGAPKLAAMTILRGLEDAPRGAYSGCFGWVGDDGAADLAMVIRSILVGPDSASVGAGGGITWRSDTAAEVSEVGLKARAPLAALGAEPPPGW